MRGIAITLPLILVGCGSDDPQGAPQLGTGDHSPSSVGFTPIAAMADGLNQPRDLAFNPLRPEELWVLSFKDDSVLLINGAPTEGALTYERRKDGYALHFMEEVTSIAFGADATTFNKPGTFGTCGESRNTYNGQEQENDFMGPTLWSSDLTVFAKMNPNGLGSHLDMLHNTPLCMGIAHESENKYWVFNGLKGSIDRYDFVKDDGIGNDEHGDGLTWRYAEGQVKREAGIPSHLVWDAPTETLFIADTGNARIAKLAGRSGSGGSVVPGLETPIKMMNEATIETVATDQLQKPAGLELYEDLLFVSDSATGAILAFDLTGELVNYVETGLPAGSLGGITFGPDGRLYFVDTLGSRVFRIDP